MTTAIDPRMLKIVIVVGSTQYTYEDNGLLLTPGLYMTAKGEKYANPIQNECTIEIGNLTVAEKNYILSETSPFNKNTDAKTMTVYAGRVSTGYSMIFVGDITNANSTQAPDVMVTLKSCTAQALKSKVVGLSRGSKIKLSAIASGVASDLNLQLNFSAGDKVISNYGFTGSQLKEVEKLQDLGNVNAYIDDNKLVVKDWNKPLANTAVVVSEQTGMIGVPELTEEGVQVKFLFNSSTILGGQLQLTSSNNPSLNGNYTIAKLKFDLANRDTNFYFDALCVNPSLSDYIAANSDQSGTANVSDNQNG